MEKRRRFFLSILAIIVVSSAFLVFPFTLALWVDAVLLLLSAAVGDVLSEL